MNRIPTPQADIPNRNLSMKLKNNHQLASLYPFRNLTEGELSKISSGFGKLTYKLSQIKEEIQVL